MAGNQTDSGRRFRYRWARGWRPLLRVGHRYDPPGIHKDWRQTDSPTPHGGESLGAIGNAPRPAGTEVEEERALRDTVSGSVGLETWH